MTTSQLKWKCSLLQTERQSPNRRVNALEDKISKVVGFTDVTSIANEAADFERCLGDKEPTIATHVLVLMVRGIFSSLHAPLGYYPTTGVTGNQLYLCLYDTVLFLETAGFKVRAQVSDGASPNRKFYKLHRKDNSTDLVFKTVNPFAPTREVFFICDVPHLIKTTRNNWENSGWHNRTKHLCVSCNICFDKIC